MNDCINWTRGRTGRNYGAAYVGSRQVLAHRLAYEQAKGHIPPGYHVDHLCKNTLCVNPDHLEAVTPAENNRRSDSRTAKQARQTHCIRGHAFDNFTHQRRCTKCANMKRQERRHKEKELKL